MKIIFATDGLSIVKVAAKKIVDDASVLLLKDNPDIVVTTNVIEGTPKQVILEEAKKFAAEFIVVGSHGRGVADRFLFSSVSHAVSLYAK